MKKYLTLAMAILGVITVIYSFFGNMSETADILGFEVNIWVYRLFWSVLAIGLIFSYVKENKKSKINKT